MFKFERQDGEAIKEQQGVPVSCDGLSKKRNRLWLHLDNIIAKFLYQSQKSAAVNMSWRCGEIYLFLLERKRQQQGENFVTKSFMIYVYELRLILWPNEGRGGGVCGVCEEEEKQAQGVNWETCKKEPLGRLMPRLWDINYLKELDVQMAVHRYKLL